MKMMYGSLVHLVPLSPPKISISTRNPNFTPKSNYANGRSVDTSSEPVANGGWSFRTLISVAVAVAALITPLSSPAIPSVASSKAFPPSSSTPFSQAQSLPTGLENGKIRACPSINPGCISSNPMSSNFASPWRIVGYSSDTDALQQLQDAIIKTQKNVKIQAVQDTPTGQYLRAEVDGGFSRDIMEFLVHGDVVSFRNMAKKVTYVYPFTTALGDSKSQEERLKRIVMELEWYAPTLDFID